MPPSYDVSGRNTVYPVSNNTALYTKYVLSPAWIGNPATPFVPGYSLSFIPYVPYEDGSIPYTGPMVIVSYSS